MPIPTEVAVVRMPDVTLVATAVGITPGQTVGLAAGSQVIGAILAAEKKVTASVPVGQQNTPVIDIRGYSRFGLWVPSTFDGSAISVWVGHDGVGVQLLYDITNTAVSVGSGVVAAGRNYDLPGEISSWPYVLFSCISVQAGTATDFVLVMRTV